MSFNGIVWASWMEPSVELTAINHLSLHEGRISDGMSLNLPFSVPAAPTAVAVAVRDPDTAAAKTNV